jgi:hypothetical protein
MYVCKAVPMLRVYFKISLKRGKTNIIATNFQRGKYKFRGENPILRNYLQ